jgi:hypothetical protein
MNRRAAFAPLALLLAGCAAVKGFFTEPTGKITLDRELFVKGWAIVEALGVLYFDDEAKRSLAPGADPIRYAKVIRARDLAQVVRVEINALLAHPEITIDKENVAGLLKALIALKP